MDRILGVDISETSIEIVELSSSNNEIKLENFSRVSLDKGIIEKGKVVRSFALDEAIIKCLSLSSPDKFQSKKAVISVSESAVSRVPVELPNKLTKSEIDDILKTKVSNYIPQALRASYTCHSYLYSDKKHYLLFTAVEKDLLNALVEAVESAGLSVIAIEPEGESLIRSVSKKMSSSEALMLVDIGDKATNISVYDYLGLNLTSRLSSAGSSFTEIIERVLKVSSVQADKIKTTFGLGPSSYLENLRAPLTQVFDKVIKGINDTLAYYSGSASQKVSKILLCGGSAQMIGLVPYFIEKLSPKNVELASSWINASGMSPLQIIPFLGAIGLALKGHNVDNSLEKDNFLSLIKKKEKIEDQFVEKLQANRLTQEETVREKQEEPVQQSAVHEFPQEPIKEEKQSFAGTWTSRSKAEEEIPVIKKVNGRRKIDIVSLIKQKRVFIPLIVLFIFLLGGSFFLLFRNKFVHKTNVLSPRDLIPIDENITFSLDETSTGELQYRTLEQEIVISSEFKATGEGTVMAKVQGTVIISNTTNTDYNLVATTRLVTSDGKLFRLDNQTKIKAKGTAEASVSADKAGATYEITKDTKLTFPGLQDSLKDKVFALAKENFTLAPNVVVTKDDLDAARVSLSSQISKIQVKDYTWQLENGEILAEGILKTEMIKTEFSAAEGDVKSTFNGSVRLAISVLAVDKSSLDILLINKLENDAEDYENTSDYAVQKELVKILSYNESTKTITLQVSGDAVRR